MRKKPAIIYLSRTTWKQQYITFTCNVIYIYNILELHIKLV
jgi:hypothetical protein